MKVLATIFRAKIPDSDASHSVAVDSYDTANDLKPAYDPLSLKREPTVSDKDLSQAQALPKKPVVKKPVKKINTTEKVISAASEKLSSWFDVDALEKKFEEVSGYKVTIAPSTNRETLHEKAQQKRAMNAKKEE